MARLPIDKRSPREFWDNQHKKIASEQIAWILTADELLRAFELLAHQMEEDLRRLREDQARSFPKIYGPMLMLGALAIENLLKALRIPHVNPLFDKRGAFILDTHDVLQLAEDAGMSLSEDEQMLLERLEQFLTWAGRYPIPLFSEALRPRTLPNNSAAPRTYCSMPGDFLAITAFAARVKELLPAAR